MIMKPILQYVLSRQFCFSPIYVTSCQLSAFIGGKQDKDDYITN